MVPLLPKRVRAQAARQAASTWFHEKLGFDNPSSNLVRLLWALDSTGLYRGSPEHPGASTLRHTAFRGLGRGRRHARNGAAWTASIKESANDFVEFEANEGYIIVHFTGCDGTDYSILSDAPVERESYRVLLWHYCQDKTNPDTAVLAAFARMIGQGQGCSPAESAELQPLSTHQVY